MRYELFLHEKRRTEVKQDNIDSRLTTKTKFKDMKGAEVKRLQSQYEGNRRHLTLLRLPRTSKTRLRISKGKEESLEVQTGAEKMVS